MAEETATYISQLVNSNPVHTDGLDQADYHMRLIKSVLQNQFPNFTAVALSSSNSELDAAVNLLTGVSGSAAFPAGSVSTPSIAFTGDPDSGFYLVTEDQVALSLGGFEQLSVSSSQMVVEPQINAQNGISCTGAYSGGTGQIAMAGAIWMYQGSSAPTGWAWCDGQTVASASNPGLNAIYGNVGGNITLPDWRCYVPVGVDNMGGAGTTSRIAASGINSGAATMNNTIGQSTHTLAASECPTGLVTFNDAQHTHSVTLAAGASLIYEGPGGANGPPTGGSGLNESGTITINDAFTGCSITEHGGGGAHNIVQLGLTTGFIIKLG